MVGHGRSSASSYLADPISPIPSHCASIAVTSTVRVNIVYTHFITPDGNIQGRENTIKNLIHTVAYRNVHVCTRHISCPFLSNVSLLAKKSDESVAWIIQRSTIKGHLHIMSTKDNPHKKFSLMIQIFVM